MSNMLCGCGGKKKKKKKNKKEKKKKVSPDPSPPYYRTDSPVPHHTSVLPGPPIDRRTSATGYGPDTRIYERITTREPDVFHFPHVFQTSESAGPDSSRRSRSSDRFLEDPTSSSPKRQPLIPPSPVGSGSDIYAVPTKSKRRKDITTSPPPPTKPKVMGAETGAIPKTRTPQQQNRDYNTTRKSNDSLVMDLIEP